MVSAGRLPNEFEEYQSFIEVLTENLQKRIAAGQKVCVIAGVDMAHLGQYFGDTFQLSTEFMEKIRTDDLAYLDCIIRQDKEALFDHIAIDQDARRICGFPTMFTVIDLLDRLGIKYNGHIFDYRQAINYQNQCAVTFAGVGLYQTELS